MRTRILFPLMSMFVVLAIPAAAQTGKFGITVGGGATIPLGNASDSMKTGGHGRVTIGYRPLDSKHIWSIEAGLHQLEQITNPADNLGKVHANILVFMARIDQDLGSAAYITGGFGMIRNEYRTRFMNVALTNTDSHMGLAAGGGLNFGSHLFAEARLMYSFGNTDANLWVPLTVGIRF